MCESSPTKLLGAFSGAVSGGGAGGSKAATSSGDAAAGLAGVGAEAVLAGTGIGGLRLGIGGLSSGAGGGTLAMIGIGVSGAAGFGVVMQPDKPPKTAASTKARANFALGRQELTGDGDARNRAV
jgi:hypothetical protein